MVAVLARVLGWGQRLRLVVASFLLVGNMLLWPSGAIAEIITGPLKASQFYGDDVNTVVAPEFKAITGANGNKENQSGGLINVGDAAFAKDNKSGQGWTFNWAPAATQAAVEATMNGSYYAWVVSPPTNIMAGGGACKHPNTQRFLAP